MFLLNFLQAEERHFDILGRLLYTAKLIAKQEGLDDGFRIVINDGPKGCKFCSPGQILSFDKSSFIEFLILKVILLWYIELCIYFWQANQFTTFMCTSLEGDRWTGLQAKVLERIRDENSNNVVVLSFGNGFKTTNKLQHVLYLKWQVIKVASVSCI